MKYPLIVNRMRESFKIDFPLLAEIDINTHNIVHAVKNRQVNM